MNEINVSSRLKLSPEGPVSSIRGESVHLRQGDLDGACGPYCLVSALIALEVMTRDEAANMSNWDGRSREGRFRDALYAFGALVAEGTNGDDLVWLTDYFKRAGLTAQYVASNKKQLFLTVADAIDSGDLAIIGVEWKGGGAHWLLVVGYQGHSKGDAPQLTHLLCLDPGFEVPRSSLWNVVLEVFNDDGSSANLGRMSSNHWGANGSVYKCQMKDAIILSSSSGGTGLIQNHSFSP